jgi:splicing factor 3A subunit 3
MEKKKMTYPDFVTLVASGLNTCKYLGEKEKLSQRKKYVRFLNELNGYLVDYLNRVSPLLNVQKEVVVPALEGFQEEWELNGGVEGWEFKPEEKSLATLDKVGDGNGNSASGGENGNKATGIQLKEFENVDEMMETVSPEQLKVELARIGMKCGGTPLDRAKRLWCARDKPLEELPAKLFTKKKGHGNGHESKGSGGGELLQHQGGNQRRIDIAKLELIVSTILGQLRPTLDATARRAERRLTQTMNEKVKEMEEEINGAYDDTGADKGGGGDGDSDDSDDEDAPIYNPKGVPLGWDGKPIPYWLFKLHGLNHFYPCEICGNESYRGRHNFEKHFAETKHSYGMKCLGIPNTKHFHGVTKIEDAQNLWAKLQENVNKDIFDASKDEEYEDSKGNVLSRATYEDLARQGLL